MIAAELAQPLGLDPKELEKIIRYIDSYWQNLIRKNTEDEGTLIGLPNPYIVPSESTFFQEMYYWDSYPVILALLGHKKYGFLARGMVDNLLYLVERFGIIPNATRFYFLSRSQPPLLSRMVWEVYQRDYNVAWFRKAIRLVELEYENVWVNGIHPNFRNVYRGLSRFYDINVLDDLAEAESGWDMTARFMGKCLDFLPVDLNSLLYIYENDLANAHVILKNPNAQKKYLKRAERRAKAMNELMWDEETGFWYDYNFVREQRSRNITIAGVYPLMIGISSKEQAIKTVEMIEHKLLKDFGVVQSEKFVENKQWDWPNGWALLQLRVVEGLINYGYRDLAIDVIRRWLTINLKLFAESGKIWEKYDVVHGRIGMADRYPTQHGFAWTNACFLLLLDIGSKLLEKEDVFVPDSGEVTATV